MCAVFGFLTLDNDSSLSLSLSLSLFPVGLAAPCRWSADCYGMKGNSVWSDNEVGRRNSRTSCLPRCGPGRVMSRRHINYNKNVLMRCRSTYVCHTIHEQKRVVVLELLPPWIFFCSLELAKSLTVVCRVHVWTTLVGWCRRLPLTLRC